MGEFRRNMDRGPAFPSKRGIDISFVGQQQNRDVGVGIATGKSAQVKSLFEQVSPYWDHNMGYGKLGTAAVRAGDYDIAESYFVKLRKSYADWHRCAEMDLWAEIWAKRGRTVEAHAILVECLKQILEESKTVKGSDKKLFEEWFQQHRSTYLKLFPGKGDASLVGCGIPTSTLH